MSPSLNFSVWANQLLRQRRWKPRWGRHDGALTISAMLIWWSRRSPTPSGLTTFPAMAGNGYRTTGTRTASASLLTLGPLGVAFNRFIAVVSAVLGALIVLPGLAQAQDTEVVRKKCVEFGFQEKTTAHESCVKQFLQSVGGGAPALTAVQQEEKYWDDVKAVGNKEAFLAYLDLYPKGRYAGLARATVVRFNTQQGVAVKPAAAKPSPGQNADRKLAVGESDRSVENGLSKKENKLPAFIALDEFLVKLPGKGGEHYLMTKLVLQTADAATKNRIIKILPLVRDRILAVLSERTVTELATFEGKDSMAKEVAVVINAFIEPQLTAIFILQQDPSPAYLRKLERLRALPTQTAGGGSYSAVAKEAAAQFWKVTEMDLPVQAVLYTSLVMQ